MADCCVLARSADFVMNPANEPGCFGRGVAVSKRIDAERDQAGCVKPRTFCHQSGKGSNKQGRSDDKDQRECNLSRHDRPSQPEAAEGSAARSLSEEMSDPRPACRAGAKPVRKPVATLTSNAKSNRRVSTTDCRAFAAASRGRNAMSARMASGASTTPSDPPASASRTLSARSCRPIRPREAPSANRVLISRSRADPRARNRPATFRQARAQQHRRRREQDPEWLRKPAPQNGMALGSRSEFECRREKPLPPLGRDSGKSRAACVLVQHRLKPGLQPCLSLSQRNVRPQPAQHLHPARTAVEHAVEAGNGLGRHRGRNPERGNFANIDAIGTPARRRRRPSSGAGSPAPCGPPHPARSRVASSRSRSESTTTGLAPGVWSSSIVNNLPSAGLTPSTEK